MEDHKNQHLDSATEMMKTLHLQDSTSDLGEIDAPDTNGSRGEYEKPSLTNLAGELEDLIISKLDPSAAIALSETNHYFHASVNLHRLPFSVVFDWLQTKEWNAWRPIRPSKYACYTCLRLKPRSAFAKAQFHSGRGTYGKYSHTRICLDCDLSAGKYDSRSFPTIEDEMQIPCRGCEILRKSFCKLCHWCDGCIKIGYAIKLRNGDWAVPNGEARTVTMRACCHKHVWGGLPNGNRGNSLSVMQGSEMFDFLESDWSCG